MLPLCHWDRVTWGRVGVGEAWGGCSRDRLVYRQRVVRSRSRDIGLSVRDVEHFVCHVVLIHPDCEAEPGFRVRIRRPSICHFRECKGNPFRSRLPPAFRFRSRSRHLVSLPQCLRLHDVVRHLLPTRFPSNPPSAYDTLTRHVCRTLHVFPNFGLISYIHYFVY